MLLFRKVLSHNCNRELLNNFNAFASISGLLGTAKSVVRSTAFEGDSRGPSIQSVLDVLKQNGIEVESKKIQVSASLIFHLILYCRPY